MTLQDRVKALNLGLTIAADFDTGRVTVTGGRQAFAFESLEQASQALDLANYVVFNTLHKMSVGEGPIASLLSKLPRHKGSCSNQNALDPFGAYRGAEACSCNQLEANPLQPFLDLTRGQGPMELLLAEIGTMYQCHPRPADYSELPAMDSPIRHYATFTAANHAELLEQFRTLRRAQPERTALYWGYDLEPPIRETAAGGLRTRFFVVQP